MIKVIGRYIGIGLLLMLSANLAYAQEGFGTQQPDKSAAVDIESTKRGLLIPRVKLTSTLVAAPVITPVAQSLLVYNEGTTTENGVNNVTPGYYYWDTNRWIRFAQQNDVITLDGDVTGSTSATKVVAIQGTAVDETTPTANQILTFVGGKWTPTTTTNVLDLTGNKLTSTVNGVEDFVNLTQDNLVSDKTITGTGITVNGSPGATLKDVTLAITPSTTNGEVMVTQGGVATWVDQSTIVPATTNALSSSGNTMTSVVNEESANAPIINEVTNTISGTDLTTTVNGVDATPVDLSGAIQAGQKTTVVAAGTGVTVGENTADDVTTYTVAADPSAITLSGDVTGPADATVVGKIQTTPVSATAPILLGQVLEFDGTNWTPTIPTVDVVNITDPKNLTSDGSITVTTGTGATLVDTNVKVADDGIDSNHIKNKAVTTEKIKEGADGQVLATVNNATVWTYPDASSITNRKDLTAWQGDPNDPSTEEATIEVVEGGTDAVLVETSIKVRAESITSGHIKNETILPEDMAPAGTNQMLVTDGTGKPTWKNAEKVTPRFFYMPSVLFDTRQTGTGLTRDLYQDYVNQFSGENPYDVAHGANGSSVPYTGGIISSDPTNRPKIAVFEKEELVYYITYYDTDVFDIVGIDEDGVLTYSIIGNAKPSSYMNIVFVIK